MIKANHLLRNGPVLVPARLLRFLKWGLEFRLALILQKGIEMQKYEMHTPLPSLFPKLSRLQ